MPDLQFRAGETESDGDRVTLDVKSDVVSSEVRSDALNAVNNYVDRRDADVDAADGDAIGEGWVDGESWEVTLYGDALGEDEDTELASGSD